MAWRFLVIDGADQGRTFLLDDKETTTIGSRRKDATIVLHDLLVSPLHCQVEVNGNRVRVIENEKWNAQGTFVNGQRVTQHDMLLGDVLRIGNTYLRLYTAEGEAKSG